MRRPDRPWRDMAHLVSRCPAWVIGVDFTGKTIEIGYVLDRCETKRQSVDPTARLGATLNMTLTADDGKHQAAHGQRCATHSRRWAQPNAWVTRRCDRHRNATDPT